MPEQTRREDEETDPPESGAALNRSLARLHGQRGTRDQGARAHIGLGLATVRTVVGAAGGTVGIHSEAGAGTSVRVTLPRASAG